MTEAARYKISAHAAADVDYRCRTAVLMHARRKPTDRLLIMREVATVSLAQIVGGPVGVATRDAFLLASDGIGIKFGVGAGAVHAIEAALRKVERIYRENEHHVVIAFEALSIMLEVYTGARDIITLEDTRRSCRTFVGDDPIEEIDAMYGIIGETK